MTIRRELIDEPPARPLPAFFNVMHIRANIPTIVGGLIHVKPLQCDNQHVSVAD
jgi:hypothetical protein